jgi:folate-binding protein YgfZ
MPGDQFAAAALVERLPRVVYRVTGERPLGYLHDVLAQDVAELVEGSGALAALLTSDGRVAAEVRVLPRGSDVLLDADEAARGGIEQHIARHAGLAGCEVLDESAAYRVTALRGPHADHALDDAGWTAPSLIEASFVARGELLVVRVAWGVPGVDIIGPSEAVDAAVRALDVPRATPADLDGARIAAGRPVFGRDVDDATLVNETPLLAHGVSMTKGCYPGQESVARVQNLGRVRRVLRGLTAETPLEVGAELRIDGAVVGTITSASEAAVGFAAIALVRSEVEPGARVAAGGTTAVVGALP